jgi:imidazolonepropionase-like amidohydrolase
MPGLIESHAHLSFASISIVDLLTYLPSYAQVKSVADSLAVSALSLNWRGIHVSQMAMGNAGELLKLSGDRNPYPGDLGVIKEGAYADVLLVDGNPLDDITVIGVLDNLRIIIKDGKIYKNTLQ